MRRTRHLSTFSSRRWVSTSVWVFLAAFLLLMALGQALARGPLREFTAQVWKSTEHPAEPDDWYLAYDNFLIDHYVLYHGVGNAIRHARASEGLLLGNSRMQFAFPRDVLERVFEETGCRFYNLAFGYVERSAFVLRLIEKHDLRPRFVVVNADGLFFRENPSGFGDQVMAASRWQAWKTVYERSLAGAVRHSPPLEWLPRWRIPFPFITNDPMLVYRSISYGSWRGPDLSLIPVGNPPEPRVIPSEVPPDKLASATAFQRALDSRGATLVLSWAPVPGEWDRRDNAIALARAIGAPFLSPIVPGLVTRDNDHLNDESAERFATAFFEEFLQWASSSSDSCGY